MENILHGRLQVHVLFIFRYYLSATSSADIGLIPIAILRISFKSEAYTSDALYKVANSKGKRVRVDGTASVPLGFHENPFDFTRKFLFR